ncbi:ArsR/SmtB family transcription factor [Streptomyces roseifaciens]
MSVDDLARVRISESDLLSMEALFALEALREGRGEGFRAWRHGVCGGGRRADPRMERVATLIRVPGGPGKLLELCTGGGRHTVVPPNGAGVPAVSVHSAVQDFQQMAVAPHWGRIRAYLGEVRDTLRDIMCRDGVEVLLDSLGPGIRWNAPALEIAGVRSGERELDGSGLVLAPSLFLQRAGHVLPPARQGAHRAPVLVFPDRPGPEELTRLLGGGRAAGPQCGPDSLAALVGRTRAAALRALREGCTNAELAERLGVSAAAVSQHTAVLRAAGLVSTRRNRSHAIHTVTRLGHLLLRGEAAERHPAEQHPAERHPAERHPTERHPAETALHGAALPQARDRRAPAAAAVAL